MYTRSVIHSRLSLFKAQIAQPTIQGKDIGISMFDHKEGPEEKRKEEMEA